MTPRASAPVPDPAPPAEALTAGLPNRLFFRLYQTANLLNKTGTRALEAHGVTTQQWAVLGALADPRCALGISVGDLAGLLMVSRQNLTGVLSRLEARGLIARSVDARDKRSRSIRLTAQGQQRWAAMQPQIESFYRTSLAGFSNPDIVAAMHHLDRLRQNFVVLAREQGEGEDG